MWRESKELTELVAPVRVLADGCEGRPFRWKVKGSVTGATCPRARVAPGVWGRREVWLVRRWHQEGPAEQG